MTIVFQVGQNTRREFALPHMPLKLPLLWIREISQPCSIAYIKSKRWLLKIDVEIKFLHV
ncbi:hypothetical protein ATN79_46685 [Paraburkholderia caribensis]|nr:hypothetical protein ATN79_46685 [Paraburkholderia caribensis]